LIYHYTNAKGLLGILKDGKIWATDVFYLNDQTEVQFGIELTRRVVADLLEEANAEEPERLQVLRLVDPDTWEPLRSAKHAHVACFCGDGDLLSQWRGYGGGIGGYALGLDADVLKRNAGDQYSVVEVLYGSQGEPHVRTVLERAVRGIVTGGAADWTDDEGRGFTSSFVHYKLLEEILPRLKAEAFEQECETRLVRNVSVMGDHKIQQRFRPVGPLVVPYIELDLKDPSTGQLPLRSLVVGPNPHPHLAKESVAQLLASNEYDPSIVISSKVPLRA
jgi:hypothetical protein